VDYVRYVKHFNGCHVNYQFRWWVLIDEEYAQETLNEIYWNDWN
jgi:hypothetical protein